MEKEFNAQAQFNYLGVDLKKVLGEEGTEKVIAAH